MKYIGQTCDTVARFKAHQKEDSGCRYIRNAIREHGWENVKVKILLVDLTLEESNRLETHYIDTLGTLAPDGYNLKRGGDSNEFSKDSKKKMSETRVLKCKDLKFREVLSKIAKKVWEKPGHKEVKSEQMKKLWENPEYKESRCATSKEVWNTPGARDAQGVRSKEVWEIPGYKEKQRDAKKYMRKFTDEELIEMNDEFMGSNDKLRLHFRVSKSVIIKHKKRLELTGKCYK
jgi:group I intron endonuclease